MSNIDGFGFREWLAEQDPNETIGELRDRIARSRPHPVPKDSFELDIPLFGVILSFQRFYLEEAGAESVEQFIEMIRADPTLIAQELDCYIGNIGGATGLIDNEGIVEV